MNNSHRLGLALFALGIIIFFGQGVILGYLNIIASMFTPSGNGFYEIMNQSYFAVYAISVVLLIAGVVMFFKGRKEANLAAKS